MFSLYALKCPLQDETISRSKCTDLGRSSLQPQYQPYSQRNASKTSNQAQLPQPPKRHAITEYLWPNAGLSIINVLDTASTFFGILTPLHDIIDLLTEKFSQLPTVFNDVPRLIFVNVEIVLYQFTN